MSQIKIYLLSSLIMLILVMIMIMISIAFLTLFERKIMGYYHNRKGPNKIGISGLIQPFSDALKLLFKEFFYPLKSNFMFYFISPMIMLILSLSLWLIYPFFSNLLMFNLNILFFLSIISMGVYGLMISGWSSNSMFSMIGSIRSIAQSISYEIILSISILIILMIINTFNLNIMIMYNKYIWLSFLFFPIMLILLISMLAEINRTPFDLAEGESELVSGFNIEYSSGKFILIFLSEYSNLMFMMFLLNLMFFYCKLIYLQFYINILILIFFITWIRMTYPRIRYDKMMFICGFYFLPFILINYILYMIYFKYSLDLIMIFN
uniref:NADH-ubiquinone oxidoreductase chain 1 n=1 Tax=Eumacrocentrus sp. QL-2013 TaxID=1421594 RepID=A0A0A6ZKX6_9HYME|nr:NADH dehydrogenase subunit 1 [Eumacrocentrus sp. QL-2013]